MSLLSRILEKTLTKEFTVIRSNLQQAIGSDFYGALLRYIQNRPIYMDKNVQAYIDDAYLFNPTVYSIVSFISQKAGVLPWSTYEVKNEKALNLYKSSSPNINTVLRSAIRTKAMIEIPDHELNQLFIKPNALQGWAEFVEQVIGFKLITGNSYVHCIGPENGVNAGVIREMWNLPSQVMSIVPGDKMQPIKEYRMIHYQNYMIIPTNQVIHLKYWTPKYLNGQFLYGVSPIEAARRVVTKSNSSFDASVAMFQNMGASGFISQKPRSKESDGEPLTVDQAHEIEKRLAKKTGPKNAGKPLVTSVPLEWQQMGMSAVDLAIIEADKMDLRTICNIYHVPSELFNDAANKTYSNTKEAGSAIYTNAVIPALTQFRDAVNMFIANRYKGKIFVDFDTSMISELQEDLQKMSRTIENLWWLTPNERRELLYYDSDEVNPLMNEYWVPAGLSVLGTQPATATAGGAKDDIIIDAMAKELGLTDYV